MLLLEAQLGCHSLPNGQRSISFTDISLLFVDQCGHSLRFCHIEFDKEDIYDGYIRNQSFNFHWL